MLKNLGSGLGGALVMGLGMLLVLGDLYWLYTSIQVGSFVMFALGLLGPLALITGLIGGVSLIFGWPEWLMALFG